MSPYNPTVPYTPNFARFAERATVFERHHTESGSSGIAYASLVSGGQADVHHVFKHPRELRDELILIPEVFAEDGYETFSWMVQVMASSRLNYSQGVASANTYTDTYLLGDDPRFQKILDRLKRDPEYKAMVITNFTVTHSPYAGTLLDEFCEAYPGQCETRGSVEEIDRFKKIGKDYHHRLSVNYPHVIEEIGLTTEEEKRLRETYGLLYRADMYRLDQLFGGVVDAVDGAGLFDEALIAFTSDHGELLWRDNALLYWWHGFQLVPEVTNISLLVSGPKAGIPVGRYAGVSRSIDVLPTLAGLAGAAVPDEYAGNGNDLAAAIRGERALPDQIAFSHSALNYAPLRAPRAKVLSSYFPGPDPAYMWITARRGDDYFKLKRSPDDQWSIALYDLATDPTERNDLYDAELPEHQKMAEEIERYKTHMAEAAYDVLAPSQPRAQTIEMLRSMGYID